MLDALGLNGGGFGLRIDALAMRNQIRSDRSSRPGAPPDLVQWHNSGAIDLKVLAGFNPAVWWSRFWPELVGDTGSISEGDIDAYLAMSGPGPVIKLLVFAMSSGDLQSRSIAPTRTAARWTHLLWREVDGGSPAVARRSSPWAFASLLPSAPFSRPIPPRTHKRRSTK